MTTRFTGRRSDATPGPWAQASPKKASAKRRVGRERTMGNLLELRRTQETPQTIFQQKFSLAGAGEEVERRRGLFGLGRNAAADALDSAVERAQPGGPERLGVEGHLAA